MVLLTRLGIVFTVLLVVIIVLLVALLVLRRRQRPRHAGSPYGIQNTNASNLSVNSPGAGKAWLLPLSTRDVIYVEDKRFESTVTLESCTPSSTRSTLVAGQSPRSSELGDKSGACEAWKVVMRKVRALVGANRASTRPVPEIRITFPDELMQNEEESLYYATVSEAAANESDKSRPKVKPAGRRPRVVVVQMSESGSGAAFVRDIVEDEHANMNEKTSASQLENVDLETVGGLSEKS
ncbi:hypothetical protein V1517DRAFT_323292 [Lipomyces orientalis]|uniref:Uncharacterized protein n=1 Tax=Lipomyces orientalis TaxID=1233043 RepID=A0ACC3TMU1_9ASCO